MTWSFDPDEPGYYAFEPERFLIPPMEGFLRRILGARWGLILVSAPHSIDLPAILEFLANFSLQQVYYSSFSAETGDFYNLEGEKRSIRTIEEVLEEARKALSEPEIGEDREWRVERIDEATEGGEESEPETAGKEDAQDEQSRHVSIPRNSDLVFISEINEKLMPKAVEAAMTGKLVVSGIRADGSFPALKRAIDLLGSGHLAAASLMGIIGLNTVARICPECKVRVEHSLSDEDIMLVGGKETTVHSYQGMGCEACGGTGYSGRILIHEAFELSEKLRTGLLESTPPRQLRMLAKREGMRTLLDATWTLAEAGETTLDEVVRIADVTDPGRQ